MKKNKELKFTIIAVIIITIFVISLLNRYEEVDEELCIDETGEIIGYLSIDRLGLYNAEVRNGINEATLRNSIGKYNTENTDKQLYNRNLCLFGNDYFFPDLKELKIGDSITFMTENEVIEYEIYSIEFINGSEQTYLGETIDNIITLIINIPNSMNIAIRGQQL